MPELNKKKSDAQVKNGKYMYCIIKSKRPQTFGPVGIGGEGAQIYTICNNDISAVVSDTALKTYPPSRENMIFHECAIEEAMKFYPVLPIRFATVAESEEQVRNILEKEYEVFAALLAEMNGKRELGLKIMFKKDFIYENILEKYEDIRRLKGQIASLSANESYMKRMQVGEMVEKALQKEKEFYKEYCLNLFSPLAQKVKINDVYGDLMVLNAAFLIDDSTETEFDDRVNKLDKKYADAIKIKYLGTIPPFNFVNLTINTRRI